MYGKAIVGGALVAALAGIQSCPAPPLAIGVLMGVGVPLAGNLLYIGLNDNIKRLPLLVHAAADPRLAARQSDYPDGLPESAQLAYDTCKSENADGRTTTVTRLAENSFKIEGVAPSCMTVATYFTDAATPYPTGTDSLQYDNLSDEGVASLLDALSQLGVA